MKTTKKRIDYIIGHLNNTDPVDYFLSMRTQAHGKPFEVRLPIPLPLDALAELIDEERDAQFNPFADCFVVSKDGEMPLEEWYQMRKELNYRNIS